MSDVSNTNDLIAEARQCHQARGWSKDPLVNKIENLANRLANALEAATRVPVQGEPCARVVTRSLDSDCALGVCMRGCSHLMWLCDACSSEGGWGATRDNLKKWAAEHVCPQPPAAQGEPHDDREAVTGNELADAVHVYYEASGGKPADSEGVRAVMTFARAAVPDADLRSLVEAAKADPEGVPWQQFWDRLTEDDVLALLDRLERAEERIDRWKQLVGKGVEERMTAEAERDAAVAAIERVRAIHIRDTPSIGGDWCLDDHHEWPCPTVAALDGAPGPEDVWEYGYELIEPDDRNVFEREGDFISAVFAYRAAKKRIHEERHPDVPSLQYAIIRRRKAGPWLPVEGEKP